MQRSLENKVYRLFLPNVDSESIPLVFGLSERYPDHCFPMLGLHPCDVKANYKEELDSISKEIAQRKVYAIGEI